MVEFLVGEAGLARAVEQGGAAPPDADDDVDARRDGAAGLVVVLELPVAQLQHVAENGDAPAVHVGLPQQLDGSCHGVGIRVVSVVVDGRAVHRNDDAAVIGRLELADAALDALPRDADGARRGDRGEEVLEVVPPGKGELERMAFEVERRAEQTALADAGGAEVGVVIDAVGDLAAGEVARDTDDVLVVVIDDHDPLGLDVLQQLSLRLGDLLDRAEELDVHGTDVRVDADVGAGQTGQPGDLPLVVHPHLADDDFGVVRRVVDTERTSDEVVEVPPRLERPALGGDERGDHLFRRRLPRRTGDGDQGEGLSQAELARQLLERDGCVGDANEAFFRRNVLRKVLGHMGHDRAGRRLERRGDELMSVEPFPLDGEEDRTGLHLARVDDDGGRLELGVREDFAAGHRGELGEGQRGHATSRSAGALHLKSKRCLVEEG